MDADMKSRSALLQKFVGKEAAHSLERDAPESSKDARQAIPTPMLDLMLRSGQVESFSYAYLTRVRFDPRGRLRLYFGEDVVVIEGRNLGEIRQKVRLHRRSEIQEGVEAEEALLPEDAAFVDHIYLTTLKEEEEANDTR